MAFRSALFSSSLSRAVQAPAWAVPTPSSIAATLAANPIYDLPLWVEHGVVWCMNPGRSHYLPRPVAFLDYDAGVNYIAQGGVYGSAVWDAAPPQCPCLFLNSTF
jgi:hypothetical protein